MKFRSMILVLTIAFSAIFVSMIGTSYAYYVFSNGTTINVTTSDFDTGLAIIFEQSQYINTYTGIPITDDEVDSLAEVSKFTIHPDDSILENAEVNLNIGIIDINIDDKLLTEDFKYSFSCNKKGETSNVIVSSGTGMSFTDDVFRNDYLQLGNLNTSNLTFDVDSDYECILKMWLHETGLDQNDLMNKKFSGLIKVNTLFKN